MGRGIEPARISDAISGVHSASVNKSLIVKMARSQILPFHTTHCPMIDQAIIPDMAADSLNVRFFSYLNDADQRTQASHACLQCVANSAGTIYIGILSPANTG